MADVLVEEMADVLVEDHLQRLGTVDKENSTNQMADVLVEDQLQPPLDLEQLTRRTLPTK